MPRVELDGYCVTPEELQRLPDDAEILLEFKPLKSPSYTGKGFKPVPPFNRRLETLAERTYLRGAQPYEEPGVDEWGEQTEKGKTINNGNEVCGRNGVEFYLTGGELRELAAEAVCGEADPWAEELLTDEDDQTTAGYASQANIVPQAAGGLK